MFRVLDDSLIDVTAGATAATQALSNLIAGASASGNKVTLPSGPVAPSEISEVPSVRFPWPGVEPGLTAAQSNVTYLLWKLDETPYLDARYWHETYRDSDSHSEITYFRAHDEVTRKEQPYLTGRVLPRRAIHAAVRSITRRWDKTLGALRYSPLAPLISRTEEIDIGRQMQLVKHKSKHVHVPK